MQKYVNLVDLVKSFPTSIYLQKSASIQPRTSLSKFGGKFNSLFIRLLKADGNKSQELLWQERAVASAASSPAVQYLLILPNFVQKSEVRKMKEKMRKCNVAEKMETRHKKVSLQF